MPGHPSQPLHQIIERLRWSKERHAELLMVYIHGLQAPRGGGGGLWQQHAID